MFLAQFFAINSRLRKKISKHFASLTFVKAMGLSIFNTKANRTPIMYTVARCAGRVYILLAVWNNLETL